MSSIDNAAPGARPTSTPGGGSRRARRALFSTAAAAVTVLSGAAVVPASAATATAPSAAFTGGPGTVSAGDVLFARAGAALTLTVNTPAGAKCVNGLPAGFTFNGSALTNNTAVSSSSRTAWTFSGTAPDGDGVHGSTIGTASSYNSNQGNGNNCTGNGVALSASYTSDNTGPVLSSALTPAPNPAGWNNTTTTIGWTATDAGSGVSSGPTPASTTETGNGVVTRTATATDRLGNVGSGAVTVRVDKGAPEISVTQTENADGSVTVRFMCTDAPAGIASCVVDGTTSDTVVVTRSRTVSATATDSAGNTKSVSVDVTAGDTTAPVLAGAPTTAPTSNGWYAGDVKVHWTASDPESGATAPADTTITGEGENLTSSATVTNGAGLSTTATSSPAVSIDRTAPTTSLSGGSDAWTNGDVTLTLSAADNLSGVARTEHAVDGGDFQTGTRIGLSTEGSHTVRYRSVDRAGNVEDTRTTTVRIDRTAPTITHAFTPSSYADGTWTNQGVTVTFVCEDHGGSGLVGCTDPVRSSAEGTHEVSGTASDGAGSSATDTATVRIDTTDPTITATLAGAKNDAGWYRDDVVVTYVAQDAPSGVAAAPAPQTLGEGRGQSTSATVTDQAGNSATASVSGIDVDKTAPVLTAAVPSGWHTDDVPVRWDCSDGLSGVAEEPTASVVDGEGDNLSATASCTDVAGNTVTRTVDGIKIDRTAPTTTADVPDLPLSGWYSTPVPVELRGSDNGSGGVRTFYRVDDGEVQDYSGPFEVGEGEHTVTYWSKDAAGNVEKDVAPLVVNVDRTAPTSTFVEKLSPESGWYVESGVSFSIAAADQGSGVAATYFQVDDEEPQLYGESYTANLSTGTHEITYWSVDAAGNAERKRHTAINVDTVKPTISGIASPAANGNGWNNTDVDVTFTCDDAGSGLQTGVAGCAGDTKLTNDGAGQQVHGDAVDVAGNTDGVDVGPINIDKTRPTLTGVPAGANAAGWHRGDVQVRWVGDDALSKIDTSSQPANSTVTGEGRNLGAGPVTIRDRAGNTSEPASVSGIKIDRRGPVVSGAATTEPNPAGWYGGAVTVDFTCDDPELADGTDGSGVATCPTSQTLSANGAGQWVASGPATDVAGNTSAGTRVNGINIDSTAPTTTADNRCMATNGFCTGTTADVVLTAADQDGLSGVEEIHYLVDGGTERVAVGSTTTVSVPLTDSGAGSVQFWAVDRAGNAEARHGVSLKWDNIAPTVTSALSPTANAAGWNRADVTVSFSAQDDDKGSGVDQTSVTAPVTVSTETDGQVVTGRAKDTAGNAGATSVTVRLDKTEPTITGAVTSGKQGADGWYTGPVTVTFSCGDQLSGVANCPDPVVLSSNGANTARGTVTDRAGNTATATVGGINIDQEKPTLTTADVNVQGQTYTLGSVPGATCKATDSVSGVASCMVTVTGGKANGVGTFGYTATATDRAGNTSTVTGTYQVVYRFDGFLQPINDTAHQVGATTSIFKAGSTVPAKLQLKKADGTVVQATAAPTWSMPVKGSSTSAPVDETAYAAAADSGSTYRWDATAQQYLYNWKTDSKGGNYWRMGVTLDDGQTYYVNIGLR